jgi:hypothetical protein
MGIAHFSGEVGDHAGLSGFLGDYPGSPAADLSWMSIPAATFHRALAIGTTRRYVLSVNLYDSSKTSTMPTEAGKPPQLIECKEVQ